MDVDLLVEAEPKKTVDISADMIVVTDGLAAKVSVSFPVVKGVQGCRRVRFALPVPDCVAPQKFVVRFFANADKNPAAHFSFVAVPEQSAAAEMAKARESLQQGGGGIQRMVAAVNFPSDWVSVLERYGFCVIREEQLPQSPDPSSLYLLFMRDEEVQPWLKNHKADLSAIIIRQAMPENKSLSPDVWKTVVSGNGVFTEIPEQLLDLKSPQAHYLLASSLQFIINQKTKKEKQP